MKDVIIDNERYNRISSQSKKKVWRENLEKRLERLNGDSMEHVYRTRAMKDIFKKEFLKKEAELYAENADAMAEYLSLIHISAKPIYCMPAVRCFTTMGL